MKKESDLTFAPDKPVFRRAEDLLGRVDFAENLARALGRWNEDGSLVVAVYGSWGEGKTSLKNFVLDFYEENESEAPYVVEFNPWEWASQDKINEAFFKDISRGLGNKKFPSELKDASRKLYLLGEWLNELRSTAGSVPKVILYALFVISLFGILVDVEYLRFFGYVFLFLYGAGLFLELFGLITKLRSKWLAVLSAKSLESIKDDIKKILRKLGKPVLIVIDDIDRLSPGEIKLVFQLIKANADFPKVVYLTLFERHIVESGLETVMRQEGKGFLEKIVQVGFDLPKIDTSRIKLYIQDGLERVTKDYKKQDIEELYYEMPWYYVFDSNCLPFFNTLRDGKRFFNSLALNLKAVSKNKTLEVNLEDFITLEILRVFEPAVYRNIYLNKGSLTRRDYENTSNSEQYKKIREDVASSVNSIIESSTERNIESVREIVKYLFPTVESALGGSRSSKGFAENWLSRLRMCHVRNFDRYFMLRLGENDLSQSEVDSLIEATADRVGFEKSLRKLKAEGILKPAFFRLRAAIKAIPLENVKPAATAILDFGDDLVDVSTRYNWDAPDYGAKSLLTDMFRIYSDTSKRLGVLREVFNDTSGLYLPVLFVHSSIPTEDAPRESYPNFYLIPDENLGEFKKICISKIEDFAKKGALKESPGVGLILHCWNEWGVSGRASEWVNNLLEEKNGAAVFLSGFLYIRSPESGYVRLEEIKPLVDIEYLRGKVSDMDVVDLEDFAKLAISAFNDAVNASGNSDTAGS